MKVGQIVQVPVFPLPKSFVFPGVTIPFHIFEERYKKMIKKVEDEQSLLAVSYAPELKPGQFYPHLICGMGLVRVVQRFDTGECDILVFGSHRVKFHRFTQEIPYMVGEGTVLGMEEDMPQETHDELVVDIRMMLIQWIFSMFEESQRPIEFFQSTQDLDLMCNFAAAYFVADPEKKQALLEESNLEHKAQVIWSFLKDNAMPAPATH